MLKSSIFNLFKRKESIKNKEVEPEENKEVEPKESEEVEPEAIGLRGDYTIYSKENLAKILDNQFYIFDSPPENDTLRMLASTNAFKIPTSEVSLKEAFDKLGFNNYNGIIFGNRMEVLKPYYDKVYDEYGSKYFKYNIKNKLIDKEIKFINNRDSIKIEESDIKYKYVLKSQKENELKKIYDYINTEIDKIDKEFMLIKKMKKETMRYRRALRDFMIFKDIKDNIIPEYLLDDIYRDIDSILDEYRQVYAIYLTSRLELIKKEYESEMYGRMGEEKTIEATNMFDNCIAMHNIILPAINENGKEYLFEIDTLLITTRGIFVLEVKNYGPAGNYELRIDSTGRWSTYYPNSEKEIVRENPNKQNNMHVINFNKFINKYLPKYNGELDSKGIIVIGNDNVKITQENALSNLKRVDELYNYIKDHPNKVFSLQEIKDIAECVENNKRNIEKQYPIYDLYSEISNNIKFIREELNIIKENPLSKESVVDCIQKTSKSEIVYPIRKVTGELLTAYNLYVDREIPVLNLTTKLSIYPKEIFEKIPNW